MNYSIPAYTWNLKIEYDAIPGILSIKTKLPKYESESPIYIPNFSELYQNDYTKDNYGQVITGGVMGGHIDLEVSYYGGAHDSIRYKIKGTNPGERAIEEVLTDPISRMIACQENHYKQFAADREHGIGWPEFGADVVGKNTGGVGIMQLYKPRPSAEQVWNWRNNLQGGLRKISEAREQALVFHESEQGRLNKERKLKNLPNCPEGIPTMLNENQVMIETIKRYNCGAAHRWEPRFEPGCKGAWVSYDGCEKIEGADHEYVKRVLSCKL